MSLSRKIADALDTFVKPDGANALLTVEDGPHRLALDVQLLTPIGVSLHALEYAHGEGPEASLDQLRAWADRLTARLTYLMEPFKLHESDKDTGIVCLRSQSPTVRHGRRGYYEITLAPSGALRFGRFHYDDATRRREPVPCQFTREVLERLADDLAASA